MRINKYLALCGVGSRRFCDGLIESGKVLINGKKCALGQDVDEKKDSISVDGKRLEYVEKFAYYVMNKPKGYVCTVKDDLGRKTVMDLLPPNVGRVVPVGRLDYDSEGLLIFTNDGDLVNRLTHPRNEVPKTYSIKIEGTLDGQTLGKLRSGVEIDGQMTKKCNLSVVETNSKYTKLSITITEGKNREIRKMFESVGKVVIFLKRVKIGDLCLTELDRGQCRPLGKYEIEYLKNL